MPYETRKKLLNGLYRVCKKFQEAAEKGHSAAPEETVKNWQWCVNCEYASAKTLDNCVAQVIFHAKKVIPS